MAIDFRKPVTWIFFELNQPKKSFKDSFFLYSRVSKYARVFILLLLAKKWDKNYFSNFVKELIVLGFKV